MRSISKRTLLALDAVRAAISVLKGLPPSDESAQLLTVANGCENEVCRWRDAPPSAVEREDMMRRVLALNVAVAKLRRR